MFPNLEVGNNFFDFVVHFTHLLIMSKWKWTSCTLRMCPCPWPSVGIDGDEASWLDKGRCSSDTPSTNDRLTPPPIRPKLRPSSSLCCITSDWRWKRLRNEELGPLSCLIGITCSAPDHTCASWPGVEALNSAAMSDGVLEWALDEVFHDDRLRLSCEMLMAGETLSVGAACWWGCCCWWGWAIWEGLWPTGDLDLDWACLVGVVNSDPLIGVPTGVSC